MHSITPNQKPDLICLMHAGKVTMAFSEAGPTSRAFKVLAAFHTVTLPQQDGNCLFERTSHLRLHCSQNRWCKTFTHLHHTNESKTFLLTVHQSRLLYLLLAPDNTLRYSKLDLANSTLPCSLA